MAPADTTVTTVTPAVSRRVVGSVCFVLVSTALAASIATNPDLLEPAAQGIRDAGPLTDVAAPVARALRVLGAVATVGALAAGPADGPDCAAHPGHEPEGRGGSVGRPLGCCRWLLAGPRALPGVRSPDLRRPPRGGRECRHRHRGAGDGAGPDRLAGCAGVLLRAPRGVDRGPPRGPARCGRGARHPGPDRTLRPRRLQPGCPGSVERARPRGVRLGRRSPRAVRARRLADQGGLGAPAPVQCPGPGLLPRGSRLWCRQPVDEALLGGARGERPLCRPAAPQGGGVPGPRRRSVSPTDVGRCADSLRARVRRSGPWLRSRSRSWPRSSAWR